MLHAVSYPEVRQRFKVHISEGRRVKRATLARVLLSSTATTSYGKAHELVFLKTCREFGCEQTRRPQKITMSTCPT